MSKLIDITDKLNFEEKPIVKVKDTELVVNNDAVSMLKVAALSEDGNGRNKNAIEMYHLLFEESERAKIDALKLNINDFCTLISESASIVMDNESDEGEQATPAMT